MQIFVAGGSGAIGRNLVTNLVERGDQVTVLTRDANGARPHLPSSARLLEGDLLKSGVWEAGLVGCDAVINLSGQSIFAQRWDEAYKQTLRRSRIETTKNLVAAIGRQTVKPKVLINGSAIGFYGPREDGELDESASPGGDFLAHLCVDWEAAAKPIATQGVRLVLLRTGVVLDKQSGALKEMLPPFKLGLGGRLGSGKQWTSWIHMADEVGLILFALDHTDISGPLNATGPNPVTNSVFAATLGKTLGRPAVIPTPKALLQVVLGQGRAGVITEGQRVVPRKALSSGYKFRYPVLSEALTAILTTRAPYGRQTPASAPQS